MKKNKPLDKFNNYAKYSSLGFQMVAIVLIGVFGGIELDKVLKLEHPIFTAILSVVSALGAVLYAVKDFIKMNPKDKEKKDED